MLHFLFRNLPDPPRDLNIRSPEPYGKLYKDYVKVIMGLKRGSYFGVWATIRIYDAKNE